MLDGLGSAFRCWNLHLVPVQLWITTLTPLTKLKYLSISQVIRDLIVHTFVPNIFSTSQHHNTEATHQQNMAEKMVAEDPSTLVKSLFGNVIDSQSTTAMMVKGQEPESTE